MILTQLHARVLNITPMITVPVTVAALIQVSFSAVPETTSQWQSPVQWQSL